MAEQLTSMKLDLWLTAVAVVIEEASEVVIEVVIEEASGAMVETVAADVAEADINQNGLGNTLRISCNTISELYVWD